MAIRLTIKVPTLLAVAVAVLFTGAASMLIRANAQSDAVTERAPLPVATTRYQIVDRYRRTASYVGTVRATSESAIGFEIGGTLDELPARAGMRVAEGTLLAKLNTERRAAVLDQARASHRRALADMDLAEKRRDRSTQLVARGLASQQNLDEAELGAAALQAAVEAAAASVRSAELELEKSALYAPYNAVVAQRLAQPGAAVGAGTPVLRLVITDEREAHIGVPSAKADLLRPGQRYQLRIREQQFSAELLGLGNDVDPTTLTVAAVLRVPQNVRINAGEPVVLELDEYQPAPGGWLPLTALIEGNRGLWTVLAIDNTGTTRRESVEVLHVAGDQAYVRGTLPDDSLVVAAGLQRISPGTVVEPQPASALAQQGDKR